MSNEQLKPGAVEAVSAAPAGGPKAGEIRRLRTDVVKYSRTLDNVQKLYDQKFEQHLDYDEELMRERERGILRADVQANRSSRTLYMLQRKVEELHDQRLKKSNATMKSQYVTNLASAHRAAVRALQSFVKQAPLYYNTTGQLPPMYKALAMLIQELTELSSGERMFFHYDFESHNSTERMYHESGLFLFQHSTVYDSAG